MDKKYLELSEKLLNFIDNSPTAFHAVQNLKNTLMNNKFTELKLNERWKLEKGGKYFVTKNDSSIAAFIVGKNDDFSKGFRIIGAHTDFPSLKIKNNTENNKKGYNSLVIEGYGGGIWNTWLDRPLSIAGRITLRNGDNPFNIESKLIDIKKNVAIIPNLAIHLNREVNKGFELNLQNHMSPLFGLNNSEIKIDNFLINFIEENYKIDKNKLVDYELYLYDKTPSEIIGFDDEFILAGKLDNLAMSYAAINSLIDISNEECDTTNIAICFDNEEIGSSTMQGAASFLLKNLLERILCSFNKDKEEFFISLENSFFISADMAHAVHPNFSEKHDPKFSPIINAGPVIKINANQRYATNSETSAVFENICKFNNIPYQKFIIRSDLPCGSTIGPIISTSSGIKTIDIGNPILGMHSIKETGGTKDQYYVNEAFKKFFTI